MELSLPEARRLAVHAQGFGARPAKPTVAHVRRLAAKIHSFQIDSVNVLVRAHYIPAFSRLGSYGTNTVDALTHDRRQLFEWWTKAACLVPIELYPLFKYRMELMRSVVGWGPRGETPEDAYLKKVYAEVKGRGPLTAGELTEGGKRTGKWWGWGSGKMALEYLFAAGRLAIAGRRNFTRLYDIAERVIPRDALNARVPDPEESRKQLLCLAAKARGVATAQTLIWYFGIDQSRAERPKGPDGKASRPIGKRLLAELVEEGRLTRANVEGWTTSAYVHPAAQIPSEIDARALVGCFDTLLWGDTQQLFSFTQPLAQQLYVPADKRKYGYYVLPFLLGDTIVARCDLKADRERRVLMVQSAFLELGQPAKRVVPPLVDELREMQHWLELDRIEVADRGDLAPKLKRAVRSS